MIQNGGFKRNDELKKGEVSAKTLAKYYRIRKDVCFSIEVFFEALSINHVTERNL